jgi:pimeloyl-ACP methyl ester carboxylesterase
MLYHISMSTIQVLVLIIISLVLILLAGAIYERRASKRAYARFNPPGRRIDIGGHRLYITTMGEKVPGRPTVVLEAGHGDWSRVWRNVMPEVSTFTHVVAYDRAGMGWSDPGPTPRTPARVADELHRLLAAAGEEGPYILVGHSMGGPISRLYTRTYPDEVLGLVWVDPAHEDLTRFFPFWRNAYRSFLVLAWIGVLLASFGIVRLAGRKSVQAAFSSATHDDLAGPLVAQVAPATFFKTLVEETFSMMKGANWPGDPLDLGSIPVISIEAQYPGGLPGRYPKVMWEQFKTGWQAIHEEYSGVLARLTRIPVQTGHVVMNEQPQVVIDAVRAMFETVLSDQEKKREQPDISQPAKGD